MRNTFRLSMVALHTYTGLWISALLYIVFVFGTLSYYADELDVWMQPQRLNTLSSPAIINQGLDKLKRLAPEANYWQIQLDNQRTEKAKITWQIAGEKRQSQFIQESQPQSTLGGNFFVRFHYSLSLRNYGGRYLTGFAAFIMLVAVFSGIFTHRRFFKDFFCLRWQPVLKAISDSHALIGIITLPFIIMLCASALLFYLSLYVPQSANYHFENGYKTLSRAVTPKKFSRPISGNAVQPISDLNPILSRVKQQWPEENAIASIRYEKPFDQNGWIIVYRNSQQLSRARDVLVFDPTSLELLADTQQPNAAKTFSNVMLGLHEGKFAGHGLRGLLFILGVLSCALIMTGSLLWLKHQKKRHAEHPIYQLFDWQNRAVFIGLPIAFLGLMMANRLLPAELAKRDELEMTCFLVSWGVIAISALFIRGNRFYRLSMAMSSLLLLGLCFLSVPYFHLALQNQQWSFLAIALCTLLLALMTFYAQRFFRES
jgi:uncharacterized iron-regulated membrane protein